MKFQNANRGAAVATLALAAFFGACKEESDAADKLGSAPANRARIAIAQLDPTQGNNVRGTVSFMEEEDGIRVVTNITGLSPGEHGFHIHEHGDCSAPDATSAGGHFNPTGEPHASPHDDRRHAGDFGNIEASSAGVARADFVDAKLTFDGPNSILGKGVIVHADRDDLKSQPSGNAGARVACGVIELQEGPPQ